MNNVIATLVAVVMTLLLIVVAVEVGEQMLSGGNVARALAEVNQIHSAARQLASSTNSYSSVGWYQLSCSGMLPTDITPGCNVGLADPWGCGIGAYAAWSGQGFEIDLGCVPHSACVQLAGTVPGGSGWGGEGCVGVNGNWNCGQSSAAWATSYCGDGQNTVSYIFGE